MTETGLRFDDLAITKTGNKEFQVEFGDFGDSIEVNVKGFGNMSLTEEDFVF